MVVNVVPHGDQTGSFVYTLQYWGTIEDDRKVEAMSMSEISKMVNFVRWGDTASTMESIMSNDTPGSILGRIAEPLGLSPKGSYILVHKATNMQLTDDIFHEVDDMDSVLVAPEESGGC